MRTYVVRRALNGLLVLWLVSIVIFSLVRILPGDAVIMQLDQAAAPTPEILSRARQELGLERPWLAPVVITFLAIWVQWIPPIGFAPLWEDPARCLGQLLIPALIIGARLAAVSMRMTRSSLLEVLHQDYIRTARAKGARERAVIVRHALKNAFIPVVTVIGQQFSVLLGGTVIVEFIFLQPGVGSLMLDAVLLRDYTVIQGAVLFFATVIVVTNLLVDLSYAWLDPRIRYR